MQLKAKLRERKLCKTTALINRRTRLLIISIAMAFLKVDSIIVAVESLQAIQIFKRFLRKPERFKEIILINAWLKTITQRCSVHKNTKRVQIVRSKIPLVMIHFVISICYFSIATIFGSRTSVMSSMERLN